MSSQGSGTPSVLAEFSPTISKMVHDAQEKTKGYLPKINAAVKDAAQCIGESNLDKDVVKYSTKTVGKVCACADSPMFVVRSRVFK